MCVQNKNLESPQTEGCSCAFLLLFPFYTQYILKLTSISVQSDKGVTVKHSSTNSVGRKEMPWNRWTVHLLWYCRWPIAMCSGVYLCKFKFQTCLLNHCNNSNWLGFNKANSNIFICRCLISGTEIPVEIPRKKASFSRGSKPSSCWIQV